MCRISRDFPNSNAWLRSDSKWTSTKAQVSEVFVRIGDHVTITDGPLAGLTGRLASLGEQRAAHPSDTPDYEVRAGRDARGV